jgi:hypothetical protein
LFLGRSKNSLLSPIRCRYWSTNSSSWLLWRFSQIYWVYWLIKFHLKLTFEYLWRTFGFESPCETVHFQKIRLLFHKVENDICLAMVKTTTCIIKNVFSSSIDPFRHFIYRLPNGKKTKNFFWNITMKLSPIDLYYQY